MVFLDKNGERSLLDEIVITKFNALPKLLKIIGSKPQITQSKLKKESKYSGGKIHHSVKALEIMKMINKEDNGLTLTEFGRKMLDEYEWENKLSPESLRKACDNIPFFVRMYEKNPMITSHAELFKLFSNELINNYPKINPKFIGST